MDEMDLLASSSSAYSPDMRPIIFLDKPKIVIIEDDESLLQSLKLYLEFKLKAEVVTYHRSSDFIEQFVYQSTWDSFCLLTDVSLGKEHDGIFLIDLMNKKSRNYFSIVMTGFSSIENAIAATKKGVYHYLTKPFELDQLARMITDGFAQELKIFFRSDDKALLNNDEVAQVVNAKVYEGTVDLPVVQPSDFFFGMIGKSALMKSVFERIQKVAFASSTTVLITGDSGSGKELVAKAIHQLSPRNRKPMVSVNCAAIPDELLESELFGHTKGAFTGAVANRKGRFELAHESTIFLDEIGDMPKLLQVKLLRVLQSRQFEPVGSNELFTVNTRVIAATHQNLVQQVEEGTFREDLFYRLNVVPMHLPPLKQRQEDIPLLISYFLNKFVSADQSNLIRFDQQAYQAMLDYSWPGNVRELENVIERLVILKGKCIIRSTDLPFSADLQRIQGMDLLKLKYVLPEDGIDLKAFMAKLEADFIEQALVKTNGNKNKASQLLGLNRTTLIEKLRRLH
jgi:DNA-binding NtrC family response regulator